MKGFHLKKKYSILFWSLVTLTFTISCEKDEEKSTQNLEETPKSRHIILNGTIIYNNNPVEYASYGGSADAPYITDSLGKFNQNIYLDFHNGSTYFPVFAFKDSLAGFAAFTSNNQYQNTIELHPAGYIKLILTDTTSYETTVRIDDILNDVLFKYFSFRNDTLLTIIAPVNTYSIQIAQVHHETLNVVAGDTATIVFIK